jgi:hypothetical protein
LRRWSRGHPDWTLLPGDTPNRIRELLRRCLEKDAQRRLRDAGEIRIAIEDVIARRSRTSRTKLKSHPLHAVVRAAAYGRGLRWRAC